MSSTPATPTTQGGYAIGRSENSSKLENSLDGDQNKVYQLSEGDRHNQSDPFIAKNSDGTIVSGALALRSGGKYKLYGYRWIELTVFCLVTALN